MTPEEIAAQKAAEDAAKKAAGDEVIDPEVEAIAKDHKAVKALLDAKRAANAEAKELRLKQEAADKLKKEQEETALKEQNKFKELAERKGEELKTHRSAFDKRLVDLHLKIEAESAGAVDADAVIALVGRTDIKVGDDYEVGGIKEAVEALKKGKPHLFKAADDKKIAPPKSGIPAPRGQFNLKPGETTKAHEDLAAGFARTT